jgi:hypothetical protein
MRNLRRKPFITDLPNFVVTVPKPMSAVRLINRGWSGRGSLPSRITGWAVEPETSRVSAPFPCTFPGIPVTGSSG